VNGRRCRLWSGSWTGWDEIWPILIRLIANLEHTLRTIPIWVKHGIDVWTTAAGIDKGRLLRSVSKSGMVNRDTLSDWAVVEESSKQIRLNASAPTTSAAPAPSSAGRAAGIWESPQERNRNVR
jgi:hypothetical protein